VTVQSGAVNTVSGWDKLLIRSMAAAASSEVDFIFVISKTIVKISGLNQSIYCSACP